MPIAAAGGVGRLPAGFDAAFYRPFFKWDLYPFFEIGF